MRGKTNTDACANNEDSRQFAQPAFYSKWLLLVQPSTPNFDAINGDFGLCWDAKAYPGLSCLHMSLFVVRGYSFVGGEWTH